MAENVLSPDDKQAWLRLADSWLQMLPKQSESQGAAQVERRRQIIPLKEAATPQIFGDVSNIEQLATTARIRMVPLPPRLGIYR